MCVISNMLSVIYYIPTVPKAIFATFHYNKHHPTASICQLFFTFFFALFTHHIKNTQKKKENPLPLMSARSHIGLK